MVTDKNMWLKLRPLLGDFPDLCLFLIQLLEVTSIYLCRKTNETTHSTKAVTTSVNRIPAPPPRSTGLRWWCSCLGRVCLCLSLPASFCCAWSLDKKVTLYLVSWKSKESPLSSCRLPLISSSLSPPGILFSSSQSKEGKNNTINTKYKGLY